GREQRIETMHFKVLGTFEFQLASGHVKGRLEIELPLIKFRMQIGNGQIGRAPDAAKSDFLYLKLPGMDFAQAAVPIQGIRFQVGPPAPTRVRLRHSVGGWSVEASFQANFARFTPLRV